MRVGELRRVESFDAIVVQTLQKGWSTQQRLPAFVSRKRRAGAQVWRLHPAFSAITAEYPSERVRRWLADSVRYTPVGWKRLPQRALASVAATAFGTRVASRPFLWVLPAIDHAGDIVVLPGNRRLRVFDFQAARCRVMLKAGYDPEAVRNEVRVRAGGAGPFPKICAADPGGSWFEEPILAGFSLPRCPPWFDRQGYQDEAFRLLLAYIARTSRMATARDVADELARTVDKAAASVASRVVVEFPQRIRSVVDALAARASTLGTVAVAVTHGDFQAGNVLVEEASGRVLLTDWEHSGERFAEYDLLVWGLQSRFAKGLRHRFAAFLKSGATDCAPRYLTHGSSPAWRRGAVALFLLEELRWLLQDTLSGPRTTLSPPAESLIAVAERFATGGDL